MLNESKTFQTTQFYVQFYFQRTLQFLSIEVSEAEPFPRKMEEEGKLCIRKQQISSFHMTAMVFGITAYI